MSWLDLKVWLNEQKELIIHSYIDNLYYIKKGPALLLKLYNTLKGSSFWLIVEPSKRISVSFSDLKFENIDEKPQKIWKLFLKDCLITTIYQIPCERILYFTLSCKRKERKLVVELLPRGVVCVLDEQDRILLCSEYRSMKDRDIGPGLQYRQPPTLGICTESLAQIWRSEYLKQTQIDVARVLIKDFGLPPEVAETLVLQCNLKNRLSTEVTENDILCIDTSYRNLISNLGSSYNPCIIFDTNNNPIGFYPYIPPQFNLYKVKYYSTLNDAINEYYEDDLKSLFLSTISHETKKTIESIKNAINRIDNLMNEMKNKLAELTVKMNTIENNYYDLEQIHQCVIEKIKTAGWDGIRVCGPIEEVFPHKGIYVILFNELSLEFNVRKSFIENYNDLRKAIAGLENSIKKAEEERKQLVDKLQVLLNELELNEIKVRHKLSRVKEWYEAYIWYITSSGFLVIGGKDASQNIKIVRRLLEPNDIILHADIHGASTVVLKTQNKVVDHNSITEAAIIAACYSKAWKLKLMSVDVFWVYGSQVSLSPPSGQYMPKGSYMVYGERNYIRNVKLQLAIGIEITNGHPKIIVGPEEVIDKRSIAYFVIIPGDIDPILIATDFIEFLKTKNLKELAMVVDVNDIAMRLPGKSNIIKKVAKPYV